MRWNIEIEVYDVPASDYFVVYTNISKLHSIYLKIVVYPFDRYNQLCIRTLHPSICQLSMTQIWIFLRSNDNKRLSICDAMSWQIWHSFVSILSQSCENDDNHHRLSPPSRRSIGIDANAIKTINCHECEIQNEYRCEWSEIRFGHSTQSSMDDMFLFLILFRCVGFVLYSVLSSKYKKNPQQGVSERNTIVSAQVSLGKDVYDIREQQ